MWYHFGPQGETRQLTDSAGTVADTYYYTAYGEPVASTGTDRNPFQYGGQVGYYTGPGAGLVLCGARWYNPWTARWMTRDPIGYEGGADLYGYCDESPVGGLDPSGLIATVRVDPNDPKRVTITIPIAFTTPRGYRPREVGAAIRGIEKMWSGRFGKYTVRAVVQDVGKMKKKPSSYNEVTIAPGTGRSHCDVTAFGLWRSDDYEGTWYAGAQTGTLDDFLWTVGHEAGHLMGLEDRYNRKTGIPYRGWENNVMGVFNGAVDERNIGEIIKNMR